MEKHQKRNRPALPDNGGSGGWWAARGDCLLPDNGSDASAVRGIPTRAEEEEEKAKRKCAAAADVAFPRPSVVVTSEITGD
jgi:hypothetical protein